MVRMRLLVLAVLLLCLGACGPEENEHMRRYRTAQDHARLKTGDAKAQIRDVNVMMRDQYRNAGFGTP